VQNAVASHYLEWPTRLNSKIGYKRSDSCRHLLPTDGVPQSAPFVSSDCSESVLTPSTAYASVLPQLLPVIYVMSLLVNLNSAPSLRRAGYVANAEAGRIQNRRILDGAKPPSPLFGTMVSKVRPKRASPAPPKIVRSPTLSTVAVCRMSACRARSAPGPTTRTSPSPSRKWPWQSAKASPSRSCSPKTKTGKTTRSQCPFPRRPLCFRRGCSRRKFCIYKGSARAKVLQRRHFAPSSPAARRRNAARPVNGSCVFNGHYRASGRPQTVTRRGAAKSELREPICSVARIVVHKCLAAVLHRSRQIMLSAILPSKILCRARGRWLAHHTFPQSCRASLCRIAAVRPPMQSHRAAILSANAAKALRAVTDSTALNTRGSAGLREFDHAAVRRRQEGRSAHYRTSNDLSKLTEKGRRRTSSAAGAGARLLDADVRCLLPSACFLPSHHAIPSAAQAP
jgi:hypothetical protein